ncbi:hypothetical protein Tco_0591637 [Tanacetum coccineum]
MITAADGGDGDDDTGDDDADDDDTGDDEEEPFEDDEEEEEHLAPADSPVIPIVDPVPSAGDTEAFETDESAPIPRPPQSDPLCPEHGAHGLVLKKECSIRHMLRTLEAHVATLITQTTSLQTQLTTALGRIATLEARDPEPQDAHELKCTTRRATEDKTPATTTNSNLPLSLLRLNTKSLILDQGVAFESALAERDQAEAECDNSHGQEPVGIRQVPTQENALTTDS